MSEAKFTAAPWRVGTESRNNASQVYAAKDDSICMVYDIWSNRNVEECKDCKGMANAHLIAAAPDLYEALDRAAMLLHGLGFENSDEYQAAMYTLAKARGKS